MTRRIFAACPLTLGCLVWPLAASAQHEAGVEQGAGFAVPDSEVPNLALPDTELPEFDDAPGRQARPHVLLANYSYTMAWPLQANSVFSDMPLVGGTVLIDVRVWPTRRDDEDRWDWKGQGDRANTSFSLYFGWQVEYGVNQLPAGARATLLMHSARAGALVNFDITDGFRLFVRGGGALPYVDMRYSQEHDPEFGESEIDEWRDHGWIHPCLEGSMGFAPSVATRELVFPRVGLAFEAVSKYCMEHSIDNYESAPVADEEVSLWTIGGAISFVAAF